VFENPVSQEIPLNNNNIPALFKAFAPQGFEPELFS